jgi:hypothetical protein
VEALLADGQVDTALELILREVVGMTDEEIAAYRADPSWSGRVAAAPTFMREEAAFARPGGRRRPPRESVCPR